MKRDWKTLLAQAKEQGLCCAEVAALHGCARSVVSQAVKRHGIKLRMGRRGGRAETRDWRAVLLDAKERGLCTKEVVIEQGVTPDAVIQAKRRHGIELVNGSVGRPRGKGVHHGGSGRARLHTESFIQAAKTLETANAFCFRLGIGLTTLKRLERAHGIALPRHRPRGPTKGART